jgi:hypothetical protein
VFHQTLEEELMPNNSQMLKKGKYFQTDFMRPALLSLIQGRKRHCKKRRSQTISVMKIDAKSQ